MAQKLSAPASEDYQGYYREIRRNFKDLLLRYFPVLMVLAVASAGASISRAVTTGWQPVYTMHCLILLLFALMWYFGKREQTYLFWWGTLVLMFVMGVGSLAAFGLVSTSMLTFAVTIIGMTLFAGPGRSIATLLGISVSVVVIAFAIITGKLPTLVTSVSYLSSIRGWLTNGIGSLFYVVMGMVMVAVVQRYLFGLVDKLRSSETKYRSIVKDANSVVLMLEPDFTIREFNPEAERIYGLSHNEALGRNYLECCIPEEERRRVGDEIRTVISGKPAHEFRNPVIGANGIKRTIIWNASAIHDSKGEVTGVIAIGIDVTEKIETEEALLESEKKYRSLFEAADDAIFLMDNEQFIDCNPKTLEIFGCTREQILGVSPVDFSPGMQPNGRNSTESAREKIIAAFEGKPQFFTWRHQRFDKTPFESEVSLNRIKLHDKWYLFAIVRDVTERYRTQEALKRSEEFRKRVFESSRLPIVIMSYDDYGYIDCNPAAVEIYRYASRDETLGKTPLDVSAAVQYDGTPSEEMARYYIEKAHEEGAVTFEWHHQRPDGETWDAEVHLMSFTADGRELLQFTLIDITERKKLESELKRSQANLSAVLESTTDLIWSVDCDGRCVTFNKGVADYLKSNYGTTITTGALPDSVVPPDKAVMWLSLYKRAMDEGPYRFEYAIPDTERILELAFFPIISDSKVIGVSIFGKNITERKMMERELLREKLFSDAIINSIPGTFFIFENGERLIRWNDKYRELNSVPDSDDVSMNPYIRFDEEGEKKARAAMKQTMDTGEAVTEIDRINIDGSRSMYLYSTRLLVNEGKKYVIGIGQDIAPLHNALRTIRESEERFRQIADNITEGFFLLEKETRKVLYVSSAVGLLFGISVEAITGHPLQLLDAIHPEDRAKVMFADESLRYSVPVNEEFRIIRSDGDVRWVKLNSFLIYDEKKEVYRVGGIVTDITETVLAREEARLRQQQLLQADKMASLGMMVSGVAHEINNPNNLIMLNSDVVKTFWDAIKPMVESTVGTEDSSKIAGIPARRALEKFDLLIDGITSGAGRIRNIVQNLKDFARSDNNDMNETVYLDKVVQLAVDIIHPVIRKATGAFTMKIADEVPPVKGNAQKLEQVLINLIANACESLDNNRKKIAVTLHHDPVRGLMILEVMDEGRGIPPGMLEKIFDPFFTTRRDSGGTGLGLAVSYGIIKEHGGILSAHSGVGEGTVMRIELPVAVPKHHTENKNRGTQ